MHRLHRLIPFLSLAIFTGCTTKDSFFALRDEAASCKDGDTCIFAGATDCLCPAPVNASRAEEINDTAESVSCIGEGEVDCRYTLESGAYCLEGQCKPMGNQDFEES